MAYFKHAKACEKYAIKLLYLISHQSLYKGKVLFFYSLKMECLQKDYSILINFY